MWEDRVHDDEDEKRLYKCRLQKGRIFSRDRKYMFLGSEEQGHTDPYSFHKRLKKLPGLILKLMDSKAKKIKSSHHTFSLLFLSASFSMVQKNLFIKMMLFLNLE